MHASVINVDSRMIAYNNVHYRYILRRASNERIEWASSKDSRKLQQLEASNRSENTRRESASATRDDDAAFDELKQVGRK